MKKLSISNTNTLKRGAMVVFAFLTVSCEYLPAQKSQGPYNLAVPTESFNLPSVLKEISGNTMLNQQVMICVQDEVGELFFYNLAEKKVVNRIAFSAIGDFEDVTMTGKELWVLKSNGQLYCITSFEDASKKIVKEFKTPLSVENDCEGICYDPGGNVLLIACKASPATPNNFVPDGFRAIYAFDLKSKTFIEKPAYLIDLKKMDEFVIPESTTSVKKKPKHEKKKDVKFEPSAIAVHPVTNQIWVMAAKGRSIILLNRKGEIVAYQPLEKDILPQPEGMTFAPDGTLYISTEGGEGSGKLMKFEMKK